MMKNKKTIFIILAVGMFLATPALANNLTIEFENDPLFNEANFLPSESITRWAKVTNDSGQTERIAVEAINVNDPNGFGNALTLEIKEGNDRLYNGPLSQFFNAGEVYLSDLSEGSQTQYNFSITFYPEAGNTFQGETLGFDILIGFQGTGGGLAPGGGGGGGGFLPPGLTIFEPIEVVPETTSATIVWETSYEATSRVVYGLTSGQFDLSVGEPSYGYEFYSDKNLVETKEHSITITGLLSGTIYYYRSVSHGSFAVTTEYSFTTLAEEDIIVENEEEFVSTDYFKEDEQTIQGRVKGIADIAEEDSGGEERERDKEEIVEKDTPPPFTKGFLASIGDLSNLVNPCLLLFVFILILLVISLLSIEKKDKQKKKWWVLNIIILVSIILYYFLCTFSLYPWIVILILIISIILLLLFRKKD